MKSSLLPGPARDPDPVRRWASGHYVRQWWRRPMALTIGGCLFLAIVIPASVLYAYRTLPASLFPDPWMEASSFGVSCSATAVLFALTFSTMVVSGRPFSSLERLGGPPLLRQLALSSRTPAEIGSALFWGSYRAAAIPWIALYGCALLIGAWFLLQGEGQAAKNIAILKGVLVDAPNDYIPRFLTPPLPRRLRFEPSFPGDPLALFSRFTIAFWLLVKPALDHAIHLAMGWWILFRSGASRHGYVFLLVTVVFFFPLLGQVLAFILRMLPFTGLSWLLVPGLAYFVCWRATRPLSRFSLRNVPWAATLFRALAGGAISYLSLRWMLGLLHNPRSFTVWRVQYRDMAYIVGPWLAWILKARVGWVCFQRSKRHWPEMLEKNFPDSA